MEKIKTRKELTKTDVIWAMFDNFDGMSTMHHLLYNVESKRKWTGELYVRNAFACNKRWRVLDENEQAKPIEDNESASRLVENMACKKCLKFYNSLPD